MKILRRLKEKNMEKLRAFRETPNTPDEIRTMEKLKDKARRKGIYLFPEPEGVTGGGALYEGWKRSDIPERAYKKHRYDRIPDDMVGKPIISVVGDNSKAKPYVLAHELGHTEGKTLRKTTGDQSTDSRLRRQAEELRANYRGYKILKEVGADKDTLRKARKGYYRQSLNTLLTKPK